MVLDYGGDQENWNWESVLKIIKTQEILLYEFLPPTDMIDTLGEKTRSESLWVN